MPYLESSQFSLVLPLIFVASIGKTHLAFIVKDSFCAWGLSYIALVTKPLFSKNLRDCIEDGGRDGTVNILGPCISS